MVWEIARFSELPYKGVHMNRIYEKRFLTLYMFLTNKLEEMQQLIWRRKEHMVSTKMVIYQNMINKQQCVDSIHVKTYGKHTGIIVQLIIALVDLT